MLTFCEHTRRSVCAELDVELAEFTGEADHVHPLVAYPPTLAISTLVQRLKGRTAHAVRRGYTGACIHTRMRGHLWSPSPAEGHPWPSSSNTSTAKPAHCEGRAAPSDKRNGLTPN